ncbi:hypothetical protein [Spirosoma pollinicola]|uniref:hypothetical protein n=1 Tax=Spirosoma pollinicola TaxID=2057025 RepID=UPI0012FE55BF|nr:hypothetical protein [Spirosoma pollinicola]
MSDFLDEKNTHRHTAFTDAQREEFKKVFLAEEETNLLLFVQFTLYTFFRPR